MLVRDVMRPHPGTARPHHPVRAVAALVLDQQVVAVPVVTAEGELCGIVDETRLVRALTADPEPAVVCEVMVPAPRRVAPDDDLETVVEALADRAAPLVPVVENGRLVGVVTARDLLRRFVRVDGTAEVPGRLSVYDAVTLALTATPTG